MDGLMRHEVNEVEDLRFEKELCIHFPPPHSSEQIQPDHSVIFAP
jgi:hypothetical protein